MRCDAAWTDVCIRNMSARGLMAETADPPVRGSYIEIRRGRQIIIGRVMWARDGRFGVRAQDRLDIDAVVNEPRLASRPASPTGTAGERRTDARRIAGTPAERAERNRQLAARAQFVALASLGVGAAVFAAVMVYETLSAPFVAIGEALGR